MGGSLPWGRVEQILSRQAASTPTARVGWSQSICPCPRAGQEWGGSLGGTAITQAGRASRTHRWVVNSGGLRAVGQLLHQPVGDVPACSLAGPDDLHHLSPLYPKVARHRVSSLDPGQLVLSEFTGKLSQGKSHAGLTGGGTGMEKQGGDGMRETRKDTTGPAALSPPLWS